MAAVVFSARALDHIEEAFEFIRRENPTAAMEVVRVIRSAASLLADHPLAGRRVQSDIRELVISFGATGFIALYRFVPIRSEVRILANRHQRAMGYRA